MTDPNETPGPEVLPPEPTPGPHAGPPPGPPPASSRWSSPVPPAAGPRRSRLADHKLALLGALAVLLLAGAQGVLWVRVLLQPTGPAALDARVNAIDTRLTRLEQRPVPQSSDLGPLTGRIAALEQKTSAAEPDKRLQAFEARLAHLEQSPAPPPPDLASLQARLTALEQRPTPQGASQPSPTTTDGSPPNRQASNPGPTSNASPSSVAPTVPNPIPAPVAGPTPKPPDLAPLEARIAALEQKPPPTPPPADTNAAQRLTAYEARLAALEKASQTSGQLASGQLAAGQLAAGQLADRKSEDRIGRIARIQAAFIALSVGQPLGEIPDAPPALSRYTITAPPTEAALRLAFPAAAQAAMAAARPPPTDQPVLQRLWAQAQDLVTVRQGDHVLLGDPAAGVLARAQTALDAGDLATAVAALASLSGPQAQALAPWLDQAHGLLAARAALATLAAQT